MYLKVFYPILVHTIVCACWNLLNYLFFIGPEPGRLTQYVYNFVNQKLATIMMITVAIIGLGITIITYFKVGSQMQITNGIIKIMSILSIAFLNILTLLILLICTQSTNSTIYISQLTFSSPFFILATQLGLKGIGASIIISTFPSALMLLGYLCQAHGQCK